MLTVWLSISIHAPRVGGDILWIRSAWVSSLFQSTPPVWGATDLPRHGLIGLRFQSTPPVWGATVRTKSSFSVYLFQSTPPVWGATGEDALVVHAFHLISIHAPRVGGDNGLDHEVGDLCISIHAPRVGGDYRFASCG